ncbi:hypothetical protein H5410_001687 [Solanum commersonii]|uniref:Uncharacterized protein n=1 Tax=Solanum commersonii TaxID=4109 RepID=A0A9J6B0A2_SOLCO|nr:hypothetical protein H5410_001687 [Solanum commersonii]
MEKSGMINKLESKCMGNKYVDEGQLLEDFPHIHAQVRALGLHYIFMDRVCRLVDVTRNKAYDQSQGKVLTANRQAWDDSLMGRMFGIDMLQLRIGGRLVTKNKMATLAEHYPLTDSVIYMCQMGPAFQEPIDGDDSTADEEDGLEKDESDDVQHGDDDIDLGVGDGDAALMAMDFTTNVELEIFGEESFIKVVNC